MIAVSDLCILKNLVLSMPSISFHYFGSIIPSISAKGERLRQPAGRGGEDLQLSSRDGDCVRPSGYHPGHPTDLPRPEATPRRGLLSADQTDQSRASTQQPRQPCTLAPAHMYELYVPA